MEQETQQTENNWPRRLGRFVPEAHARKFLIAACVLFFGLAVWWIIALPQGGDLWFYKHWSRLVALEGISAAYSGQPSEGYVDYPPFLLYAWGLEGHLYHRFVDPTFDVSAMFSSHAHTFGLAMIAVIFHLATGVALYRIVGKKYGGSTAAMIAVLFLLNPATLFNIGYLGLPDSVHSFWLVLAFGLAPTGRWYGNWASAALAALTKPQAWGMAPLFLWRRLWTEPLRKNLLGVAVSVGVTTLVIAPFIVNGKLADLATLPAHMASVQPLVSAQAHNLWWLASEGNGLNVPDATLLIGPITYHHAGLALLCVSGFFILWLSHRASPAMFLQLPAFQAFTWFCLTTRAHENHWFFVLALAALALPSDRRMLWIFAAVSVTGFFNLLFHDEYFGPQLMALISKEAVRRAELINSVANLAILAVWTVWLILARKRMMERRSATGAAEAPLAEQSALRPGA